MPAILKQKILEGMQANNLSISALERKAGLSIHAVRNILKGRVKNPSAQALQAIAQALGCSITEFLERTSVVDEKLFQAPIYKQATHNVMKHPKRFKETFGFVFNYIQNRNLQVSFEVFFEIAKKVYVCSLENELKKLDIKYAAWLVESLLRDKRGISATL